MLQKIRHRVEKLNLRGAIERDNSRGDADKVSDSSDDWTLHTHSCCCVLTSKFSYIGCAKYCDCQIIAISTLVPVCVGGGPVQA